MARVLVVSDHIPHLYVEVVPDHDDDTVHLRCTGGCNLRDEDNTADAVYNAIVHLDQEH